MGKRFRHPPGNMDLVRLVAPTPAVIRKLLSNINDLDQPFVQFEASLFCCVALNRRQPRFDVQTSFPNFSSNTLPNDRMIPDPLVTLIVTYYRALTRGPYGVSKARSEAQCAEATSTQRIIIDESKLAWTAFFAASKAAKSTHGFAGKAELARLLAVQSIQSIDQRKAFAKQLAAELSSGAPQSMDSNGDNMLGPAPKRHRMYYSS